MRAGVAQIALSSEISTNIERICSYLKSAANSDVDFLCFPECSLTGYIRDFHNINWNEVAQALDELQEAATLAGITIAVGTPYIEQENVYNAAVVISTNHRLRYFKNNLTDFDKRYFTPGKDILSFEVKGTRCGILICRDQNYPQLAQKYAKEGARIIFLPAAHYYPPLEARHKVDKNRALPIARAIENRLFVAKASAVGFQNDYVSLGHSLVVDPEGLVVCEAGEEEEALLYYDL